MSDIDILLDQLGEYPVTLTGIAGRVRELASAASAFTSATGRPDNAAAAAGLAEHLGALLATISPPVQLRTTSRNGSPPRSRTARASSVTSTCTGPTAMRATSNSRGPRTCAPRGDGTYEVTVDSGYTWNDRVDPNPQYSTDRWKSTLADATLGQADPYDMHITLHAPASSFWTRTAGSSAAPDIPTTSRGRSCA